MAYGTQKTLIATAATLALLSSIPAHAYDFKVGDGASSNTFSVYGILDGSVYVLSSPTGKNSHSFGWASNNSATSRLGFAPSRDLGQGLTVGGQLEQEIEFATGGSGDGVSISNLASTNGQTGQFNRAANVYLRGNFGEFRLGRQSAPALQLAAAGDALGYNSGGYLNAWVYAGLANSVLITGKGTLNPFPNVNGSALSPSLFNDGLVWVSPTYSGIQAKVFHTFGSNLQPTSGNTGTAFNNSGIRDLSVTYTNQGLLVGFDQQGVNASSATYTGAAVTNTQLIGSYKFGDTKVNAAFGRVAYNAGFVAAATVSGAPDNVKIWSLGGTQNLTPKIRLGVSYTDAQDATVSANGGTKILALNADYSLDSTTNLYAQVSSSKNSGASAVSGVYGSVIAGGGSVNAVFTGVRFKF